MIIEGLTSYITAKVIYDGSKKIAEKIKNAGVKVFFEERIEGVYKQIGEKLNRKDSERKFQNHDLQRAVILSYYKSVLRITDEFLKQSVILSDEYRVDLLDIRTAVKAIQHKINVQMSELKDEEDPNLLDYNDTSLLLNPTSLPNIEEHSKDVEKYLYEKTMNEYLIDTPLYKKLVKENLYDYISRFFALEIKENPRVYNIFTAQAVVENKIKLAEIQLAAGLIADITMETSENVKLLLDMMVEMKSMFNGFSVEASSASLDNSEASLMLEFRRLQFRIDNAEIIEDLEQINSNLFRASIPLIENASAIKEFLDNLDYLENTMKQNELKTEVSAYQQQIEHLEYGQDALIKLVERIGENPLKPYRVDYKNEFLDKYKFNIIEDIIQLLINSKELCSPKIKQGFRIKLNFDKIISELKDLKIKVDKGSPYFIKKGYEGFFPLEKPEKEGLLECLNSLLSIGLEIMDEQKVITNNIQRYIL